MLRQNHRPGEKMFVDWAGDTLKIYDSHTGAGRAGRQQLHLRRSHPHATAGGLDRGATRGRWSSLEGRRNQQWALHYSVGVLPARPCQGQLARERGLRAK